MQYFKCDKDCAVFVAIDKLTDSNTVEAAKVTKTSTSDPLVPKPLILSTDQNSIKCGDHVIFYGKRKHLIRGIARWTGFDKSDGTKIVEIELVSDIIELLYGRKCVWYLV